MGWVRDLFDLYWGTRAINLRLFALGALLSATQAMLLIQLQLSFWLQLPVDALFLGMAAAVWLMAAGHFWRRKPPGDAWYRVSGKQILIASLLYSPHLLSVALNFQGAKAVLFSVTTTAMLVLCLPFAVLERQSLRGSLERGWKLLQHHSRPVLASLLALCLASYATAWMANEISGGAVHLLPSGDHEPWQRWLLLAGLALSYLLSVVFYLLSSTLPWPTAFLLYQRLASKSGRWERPQEPALGLNSAPD